MSSAPSPGANPPIPPPVTPVSHPVPPPITPPIPPPVIVPPPPPPPALVTPSPPRRAEYLLGKSASPLPTPISPPSPVTPSPPPPSPTTPSSPLTPSPPPPTPISPPSPVTPSPPPPSPTTPSPPLTPSPPPPTPISPPAPLTPSPRPPSPTTPSPPPPPLTTPLTPISPPPSPLRPSSPSPPSPTTPTLTPTPPRSGTLSPPPPTNPSSGGSSSPQSSSSAGLTTGVAVGIAIGGVALLVVVLVLICFLRKKKRRSDHEAPLPPLDGGPYRGHQQLNASRQPDHVMMPVPPSLPSATSHPPHYMSSSSSGGYASSYSDNLALPSQSPGVALGIYKGTFNYEELSRATNGFSEANLLGQGGFGYVFKGMLPNGKEVAVKQLKVGSSQGEREFQAEVGIISRVHHKHLVPLVGYCIADAQRLLVYEFVPNNTLEFHLHGKGRPPMAWSSRLKIAVGSAKGLSYLHDNCNPKIIHRDIKASNILIDFNFEAKVADFGLAKIASDTNTHVSTRVMGTFGYLAPEYAQSGKLTEKSDVFSFGVVLSELITGRRPIDANNVHADNSLVDWARPLLNQASETGNFEIVVDTRLNNDYDRDEMARMVACAAACVRSTACRRPRMDQIVRVLEGNISPTDLNQGITPGQSNVYGSYGGSSDYDSSQDNEGINYRFKKVGLETQDLYSNPISEHDLYRTPMSERDLYDQAWSPRTDSQTDLTGNGDEQC